MPVDNAGKTLVQEEQQGEATHLLLASDWMRNCALWLTIVFLQEKPFKIYTEEAKW